jgi:formate-dependent nitrite reductase membrane component NrfD
MNAKLTIRKRIHLALRDNALLTWLLCGIVGGVGSVVVDMADHIGENPSRDLHTPILLVAFLLLIGCYLACVRRLHAE